MEKQRKTMMALLAVAAAVVLLLSLVPAGTVIAESDDEVEALIRLIGDDRVKSPPVCDDERCKELEKKHSDIRELRKKLESKRDDVWLLFVEYVRRNHELKEEIYTIKKENNIRSYDEAVKVPRIRKNLSLIQRRDAYMERLYEILIRANEGIEELLCLERQIEDDIELIRVLGEEEIDGLVQNINSALEKYMPDAGELVIDVKDVEVKPSEEIWKDIVKKKR